MPSSEIQWDEPLRALVHRYLADELGEEDAALLLRRLEETPELVDRLYELQLLEARLYDHYAQPKPLVLDDEPVRTTAPTEYERRLEFLIAYKSDERPAAPWDEPPSLWERLFRRPSAPRSKEREPAPKSAKPVPYQKEQRISAPRVAVLGLLGLLLFAWGVYSEFGSTDDPSLAECFGTITGVAEARVPEGAAPLATGRSFDNEKIVLEAGLVELTMANGVRLVLEGPAEFQVDSPLKSFCALGRVSAEVPPAGKGFEVATPQMTVRDFGTEFVVDVSEAGTQTHVLRGSVEAQWLTREWLPVPQGRGIVVPVDEPMRQLAADPGLFVSRTIMHEKAATHADRQCRRRRELFERDAADDASLVQLDFDERTGKATGAGIVRGRWKGTKAARFRDMHDTVKVDAPGAFSTLTLLASVRFDGLSRPCNTILATEGFMDRPGFCWNVERTGRLQLQIMSPGSRSARKYESPPRVQVKQAGGWIDLAVTVDTRQGEIVHYLNGTPVATLSLAAGTAIPLDTLTVGNWLREGRTPLGRQFEGCIASVDVFSRILSPEEIKEYVFE